MCCKYLKINKVFWISTQRTALSVTFKLMTFHVKPDNTLVLLAGTVQSYSGSNGGRLKAEYHVFKSKSQRITAIPPHDVL